MLQHFFTELRPTAVSRLATCILAIVIVAIGPATFAQTPATASLDANHAAANAILHRDNGIGVFTDASSADGVILLQPESGLVCVDAQNTLQIFFETGSATAMVGCRITLSGAETGQFDVVTRALTVSEAAEQIMHRSPTNLLSEMAQFYVDTSAQEISGQPWTGAHVEVGGGNSPPAPPYTIARFQGVRTGAPVYLRVAYAHIGRWIFTQRIEAPLSRQAAAETVGSLQFYNMLMAAQTRSQSN